MDNNNSITKSKERKRGQHLRAEERGIIQGLKRLGYSNRAIAREIHCSPSTVEYELQRGTAEYSGRGRKPSYPAKRLKLFPKDTIPCTKTLYNQLWNGELPLTLFELPEVLSRRIHGKPRINKRSHGKSIDERPAVVQERTTFGHWEADTVVGQKKKGEPVAFSIVELLTGYYLTLRINSKTNEGVGSAMQQLYEEFAEQFPQVFRSITADNGCEFSVFDTMEKLGTDIYFAHPYSFWERPVNERSNRLLGKFIPKGKSMSNYSKDDIRAFSDEINSMPRKRLGYLTPEELFDEQLDKIYNSNK